MNPRPSRYRLWTILLVGIAAISCASLFIRLAQAPALSIATYRVAIASLLLLPRQGVLKGCCPTGPPEHWRATVLSGLFLASHFAFWIQSLQWTSVASSVTLVSTTPIFTAVISTIAFRERPSRILVLAIVLSIAGTAMVARADIHHWESGLRGDLLALAGAMMAAGYFLMGRKVRPHLPLERYLVETYGTAALVLLAACLLFRRPLHGFSPTTYLFLLLLGIVPQLIGHSAFNWALRYLDATTVAVLTLGEPLGATILALIFLGERPGRATFLGLTVLGMGILLGGLAMPSLDKKQQGRS